MQKIYAASILSLLLAYSVHAQSADFIYGSIIDSKTGQGIAFATVLLKDASKGVVADEQGGFSIPKTVADRYEALMISCIGYETKQVDLKTLKQDSLNTIPLKVAISLLDEVVVTAAKKRLSVRKIVRKAIQQIPFNYSRVPFSYTAYYRDYQKQSDTYINLNEAIVEIHDNGFDTYDRSDSNIRLLDYKTNSDFNREPSLEINYDNTNRKFIPNAIIHPSGGNELTILMTHDAIRNYKHSAYSFMYVMEKDFIKNHDFKLTEVIQMNDDNLYVIDFKLKPVTSTEYLVTGQLFINRNTFAIHKLDYALFLKKGKEHICNIHVEYKEQHGLMYLNYISFNNTFKAPDPEDFGISEVAYNPYREYLQIAFNNPYSEDQAGALSNYEVKIDNKKIAIRDVILDPSDKRKIKLLLDFKDSDPPIITSAIGDRLSLLISNVTDIEGRVLGEQTLLKYKQYRELFVQEVHTQPKETSATFIDKFLSLRHGHFSASTQTLDYWMNTPLKKEVNDK
ncbi:carboxypeptidase-like regulatory domain-containing protein [Seonamhaeicola sp.]|uniref:carboxypeptidase-like regulatory domain-containing protein n=1 Tax=Seonamhaeicola sp. TaxID=1912245 RepID=UPI002639455D|nr:carboxypeptidase-like regulatory domain-containing protein [Seonamhaeicola sp.]